METKMASLFRNTMITASIAAFALLAGCAEMNRLTAPPAVAYNPPGTALAALPSADVARYRVTFATGSYRIDADGQAAINSAADSMQSNPALTATVIGSADSVGGDASNMLLSKQRATAVHNALLETGKVTEQRIETRWVGQRQPADTTTGAVADPNDRAVEIAVH
jgi:outer membrane protein OmpA-like peptidoglycan-associated protein